MAEEKYKPKCKCRWYINCSIYGADLLKEEFEKQMCGTGQEPDHKYIPKIPLHENIREVEGSESGPCGICPAFEERVYMCFTYNVKEQLGDVERILKGEEPIVLWR